MINLKNSLLAITLIFFISIDTGAQNKNYRLTDLSLNDLSAFDIKGTNWTIAGGIKADYRDSVFTIVTGKAVLLNNIKPGDHTGKNLLTNLKHGDIYLELDYNMPRGSNSGIYFQGRYEVQLFDSWGVAHPRVFDNGSIYERWDESKPEGQKGFEGHPALKNASFAPGIWQHLEVLFQAPRFDAGGKKISDARFLFVKLNGVIIHENIILHGPTRAAAFNDEAAQGPIMIQGDHGMVALRNIRYAPQNELKVTLTDLNYKYYEGKFENETKAFASKPLREGKTAFLDSRLADARNEYALLFEGKINVPEQDTYFFTMLFSGEGGIEIDGKTVIAKKWTWIGADALTGSAELSAGAHNFKVWYNKQINWTPPGLSLVVQKPNTKAVALHTTASMPERVNAPLIDVESLKEPEMVRSFQYRGTKKLTHVISVGGPTGVNYSYNLLQGALLQAWKGDFLNVTEMWYQRGEPQTSEPLGAPIVLSGRCPVITDAASITDSVAAYHYKGYRMDALRYPVFLYEMNSLKVEDALQPWENNKGLDRSITFSGGNVDSKINFRIAEGNKITSLGNGLYSVDDQTYYIRINSANAAQASVITASNQQVLITGAGAGSIRYSIIW